MVSWIISRLVVLVFGTLYPAYYSYKAVKSKDIREYVKWMMYWIIFALYTAAETMTDLFISWVPFYYELKIAFVVWLLSPYTKGSSVLYRKFVHPTLSSKEKDIDDYLLQAKDRSYETLVHYGRKGLDVVATAAVSAAAKSQVVLSDRLRSFSAGDLADMEGNASQVRSGQSRPSTAKTSGSRRPMTRSQSETVHAKGWDFDEGGGAGADFELLQAPEPFDDPALPQATTPKPLITMVLAAPEVLQPESNSSPSPEPLDTPTEAATAFWRPSKRRAPEPPPRSLRPITRSLSKSMSSDSLEGGVEDVM